MWQYAHGVGDDSFVSPDSHTLDSFYLARPGNDEIQLDLLLDYQVERRALRTFQAYLRQHQPPVLAVWGKNDPFFMPPGAEAFKRDVPRPTSASSTAATSRWRPTHARSARRCATSSPSISADAAVQARLRRSPSEAQSEPSF